MDVLNQFSDPTHPLNHLNQKGLIIQNRNLVRVISLQYLLHHSYECSVFFQALKETIVTLNTKKLNQI